METSASPPFCGRSGRSRTRPTGRSGLRSGGASRPPFASSTERIMTHTRGGCSTSSESTSSTILSSSSQAAEAVNRTPSPRLSQRSPLVLTTPVPRAFPSKRRSSPSSLRVESLPAGSFATSSTSFTVRQTPARDGAFAETTECSCTSPRARWNLVPTLDPRRHEF